MFLCPDPGKGRPPEWRSGLIPSWQFSGSSGLKDPFAGILRLKIYQEKMVKK
jgi:hypothetical protein